MRLPRRTFESAYNPTVSAAIAPWTKDQSQGVIHDTQALPFEPEEEEEAHDKPEHHQVQDTEIFGIPVVKKICNILDEGIDRDDEQDEQYGR